MKRIRYAVVGLGWIDQVAVLPAFKNAKKNSELVALFSSDLRKLKVLGKKYGVKNLLPYEQYDDFLKRGEVDAVYIGLPNSQHCDYTVRAAQAGVHVLCEKPMAPTQAECEEMMAACRANDVKLMIAYRLHFDPANLQAAKIVNSGKIGEPRIYSSVFGQSVASGNIRLKKSLGGGPLLDMGIYCLNAARYLFQAEPIEGFATTASTSGDDRFAEVEEMLSATLRFPDARLAQFTCSFGSTAVDHCEIVGTKGVLRLDPAFDLNTNLEHVLTVGEKTKRTKFKARDQFAPELMYFSDCILKNREPEPSGLEGLNDVKIIQALYRSARDGELVKFPALADKEKPNAKQTIKAGKPSKPKMVNAAEPSA